ncbi:MAG: Fic family protein [Actinomycetaceae bacterium]|nr:Fic family protein [Actinomycetaceae bacterium]
MTSPEIGALVELAVAMNRRLAGDGRVVLPGGLDRLAGAIGSAFQTWGGRLLYPDVWVRAAVLLRGIAQAHPFDDGNKRTAWMFMVWYLHSQGLRLGWVDPDVAEAVVLDVVLGDWGVERFAAWLSFHAG